MGSFSYHVGQRIKKYRKSRGYTIEQFSAMINKSKATVSKYENGTITIDVETLYDIARALDIDLKCFIDYQPPALLCQPNCGAGAALFLQLLCGALIKFFRFGCGCWHWAAGCAIIAMFIVSS